MELGRPFRVRTVSDCGDIELDMRTQADMTHETRRSEHPTASRHTTRRRTTPPPHRMRHDATPPTCKAYTGRAPTLHTPATHRCHAIVRLSTTTTTRGAAVGPQPRLATSRLSREAACRPHAELSTPGRSRHNARTPRLLGRHGSAGTRAARSCPPDRTRARSVLRGCTPLVAKDGGEPAHETLLLGREKPQLCSGIGSGSGPGLGSGEG